METAMQWGKDGFLINGIGSIGYSNEKIKLDLYLTSYTKINSRWIVDLNVKTKTKFHVLEDSLQTISPPHRMKQSLSVFKVVQMDPKISLLFLRITSPDRKKFTDHSVFLP